MERLIENKKLVAISPAGSLQMVENRRAALLHIGLPLFLLLVGAIGGIRFSSVDGSILFLAPPLICLVFAAALMVLFLRSGLVHLEGWISEKFSLTQNLIDGITLAALFFASVQVFNSLLPEQGMPFWIVSFCFLWTLWTNLFAELDTKKLLRSLAAMFCLALIVKYLFLANLTKPANEGWISSIINNPGQTAFTWLLDLPQFSAGTGYLQFFTLALFVIALYFLPPSIEE
jgi:predicted membrane channel-forming protein YqfA (hemolysin III family)